MKKVNFTVSAKTRNILAHLNNNGFYFEYVVAERLNGVRLGQPGQPDIIVDGKIIECKHFTIRPSDKMGKNDTYNNANFPQWNYKKSILENLTDYTSKFDILAVYFGDIENDKKGDFILLDTKAEQIQFLLEHIYKHNNKYELATHNPNKSQSIARIYNRLKAIKKAYAELGINEPTDISMYQKNK